MNVRPANEQDADAVLALTEGLTRPRGAVVYVAEIDGQIVESYGFDHHARAYALKL